MSYINNSSFWLSDNFLNDDIDVLTGEVSKDNTAHLIRLASYRRAIANFVNLVTGKDIPVTFNQRGDSYTDGERVVISANLNEKEFDSAVGLALHEGSHIKLTNFDTLKDLLHSADQVIPNSIKEMIKDKYYSDKDDHDARWMVQNYIVSKVKQLLNIIEDRRIDNFIFTSAPGYKGYYHALYNKYFNDKSIDKALASKEYRELTWDSYMFRICNITNENRDLNALPGFMNIWNTLNLRCINRLKSSDEALEVAFDIFRIVERNLPTPTDSDCEGGNCEDSGDESSSCDSNNMSNEGSGGECNTPSGEANDDGSKAEGGEAKKSNGGQRGGCTPTDDLPELSNGQRMKVRKAIKKQEDFLDGDIRKKKITKADYKKLQSLEESGSEIKEVGKDYESYYHSKGGTTDVIVIKNFSQRVIDSGTISNIVSRSWERDDLQNNINAGLRLGRMLGKKLKVRSEERNTKFTRLESGKIDKRLIASLGFGAERIFTQTMCDKYNPANIHLSIDASGSMNGSKWEKTQIAAVAIAKAASMIDNIHVQISYRTTQNQVPLVLMAYDSRTDNINKIQRLFKNLSAGGLTPEGLCFEAIKDIMVQSSANMDSYFINFSDGEPYANPKGFYYGGEPAAEHTRKRVNDIKKMGIKVLSYFISSRGDYGSRNFQMMYGRDAETIDVNALIQLAKTLNKLFLKK